jgi:hypothetical protein
MAVLAKRWARSQSTGHGFTACAHRAKLTPTRENK